MNTYTNTNIGTVSDLRLNPNLIMKRAQEEPVFVFHRSTPKVVMLSLEKYQEIMDIAEDYYLSLRVEKYEKEDKSKIKWISQEEVEKRFLKKKK